MAVGTTPHERYSDDREITKRQGNPARHTVVPAKIRKRACRAGNELWQEGGGIVIPDEAAASSQPIGRRLKNMRAGWQLFRL